MCELDTDITPTKRTVFLRKNARSNRTSSVKEKVTRLVVQGESSSEESSEESTAVQSKYIFRCISASDDQKRKQKCRCGCGSDCDRVARGGRWILRCPSKEIKDKKHRKKAVVHFEPSSSRYCHCNGGDHDGWLCDSCRAEEKKKGIWRVIARDCDSGSSSDHSDTPPECDCGDGNSHFARKCEEWLKAAAKKRKQEQKQAAFCSCHRPGCNVCVFVKY